MANTIKNEVLVQTLTAILIAYVVNVTIINTLYAYSVLSVHDVALINIIMTITSVMRSYCIRRIFADKQSKKMSIIETLTNASIGMVTGYVTYYLVIIPLCNSTIMQCDNAIAITLIMTVVSMARTYVIRSMFKRAEKV